MYNPFKILNISPQSNKKEVIEAAALAMRKKEYSGQEIAVAQKELLDPLKSETLNFVYDLNFEVLEENISIDRPEEKAGDFLKRLTLFDE